MEYSPWFVMLIGMGTVFIGLICLVYLIKLMSLIIRRTEKVDKADDNHSPDSSIALQPADSLYIENRGLFDAVIGAVIAEYIGAETKGIRICSVKRVDGTETRKDGFVPAIAAAIAVTMGENTNAVRIRSIRRI